VRLLSTTRAPLGVVHDEGLAQRRGEGLPEVRALLIPEFPWPSSRGTTLSLEEDTLLPHSLPESSRFA